MAWSSVRCSPRVGTRTVGSTSRTSVSNSIRNSFFAVPGLIAIRSSFAIRRMRRASSARFGARVFDISPLPQTASTAPSQPDSTAGGTPKGVVGAGQARERADSIRAFVRSG